MKHIFYLIGIAYIIYEILWVLNPKDMVEKHKNYKEESKNNKDRKWDEMTKEYKELLFSRGLVALTFVLWMFAGLLTFNWVAFMLKIGFNFIVIHPLSRLTEYNWMFTVIHWLNSIIGMAFGIFVVINSYHLKIDLKEWLLGLL